jgi:hypothetical protein
LLIELTKGWAIGFRFWVFGFRSAAKTSTDFAKALMIFYAA